MSQEHFRAQDAFGATVLRRSAVGAGSRVKGQWDFECYGPLRLADPGQAAALLTRAGILVPLNVAEGFLWWKQWMDIRRRLQVFSRERREGSDRLHDRSRHRHRPPAGAARRPGQEGLRNRGPDA